MKNKIMFAALIAALPLAACGPHPMARASKYGVQNEAPRYGDWLIEPNRCTVESATQDFVISTDGNLTRTGLLPLKLTFNKAINGQPRNTLTGIPVPVPQDGQGKNYTVYLEYSPRSVADLWYDGTFLTLAYQLLGNPQTLESYLQTRGLVEALSHLKEYCK